MEASNLGTFESGFPFRATRAARFPPDDASEAPCSRERVKLGARLSRGYNEYETPVCFTLALGSGSKNPFSPMGKRPSSFCYVSGVEISFTRRVFRSSGENG